MTEDEMGNFIEMVQIEDVNSEDNNCDDIAIGLYDNAINLHIINNPESHCNILLDKGMIRWLIDTCQDWLEKAK